jgi:hypothetical protein
MGVLETRELDFDRVIILSMNEGSLPGTGSHQSFIPYNLRFGFRLPTPEYQDAIYAYYFYRLIQRASDISLLYNNRAEGLNTGGKSRFIYQLKYDQSFSVSEWSAGFDVQSFQPVPLRVEKSPEVMEKLFDFCPAKGGGSCLSPSALNSFIDCPLQFYFRYLAGIVEPVELLDEIDPALFGTLLHETVSRIYGALENPVDKRDIGKVVRSPGTIRQAIDDSFRSLYFKDEDTQPEGRNLVIREIIYTYVTGILKKDMEFCPFEIRSLEDSYHTEIHINTGDGDLGVRLGGKIDRIDSLQGAYRVLDYKTGSGRVYFGSVGELFDGGYNNRNQSAFQVLLYAKLFIAAGNGANTAVTPGLYHIRDIFKNDFRYHLAIGTAKKNTPVLDYSNLDGEFTRNLEELLGRLYNPAAAFTQTEDEDTCRNCLHRGICHR